MNDNITNTFNTQEQDPIDIKKELGYYLFFWPWFILSIILAGAGSYVFLKYEDRVFQTNAQIQIKEADSDPSSFLTGGYEIFGFNQLNVENDIAVITSQHILSQVVQRLDLQTKIYSVGRIKNTLKNNNNQLFSIVFKDSSRFNYWELTIANKMATISNDSISFNIKKGQVLEKEGIIVTLEDSIFLNNQKFQIYRSTLNQAVSKVRQSLLVTAASDQGEIVNLSIRGNNINVNEDILNTIVQVLAEDQVTDKRKISEVSLNFIEERLKGLSLNIDSISKNTIDFQTANDIFDPMLQTGNALNAITKGQEEAFGLGIQIEIAKALLEKLQAQSSYNILPANIGIDNESVNTLVNSYNTLVTQRDNLLTSATTKSPVVMQLSSQLQKAMTAIQKGVERYVEGLEVSLSSYQQMEGKTRGVVATLPSKENTLRGYARSFKIVEELYVFLLQRKEEASITYISALPNIKVLSYGVSSKSPISPNVQLTYLLAIFIGLLFPFGILFVIKLLDTKINTREDLEKGLNGITILGEVPFEDDVTQINNSRGITAESTRVLRSSLSFLLKSEESQIITVTSTTKGEGKSFVSFNIAQSYAALGKKVILVGGDLRNPQLHNRLGIERTPLGISTFLSDENFEDLDSLIIKPEGGTPMDYILSGAIPPNPSELLMRPRMKILLDALKLKYDFIIVDSAPLLLVSDTSALLPLCDLVVYVTRAQYSDKKIFPFILEMQNRPDTPPFGMVLNGLIAGKSGYGYRYSYKYRYNYSYKYNYGYGYGYGSDED